MNRVLAFFVVLCMMGALVAPAFAQDADLNKKFPFRPNAKGILQTSLPARQIEEGYSRHDITEILAAKPNADWAKEVRFHRDISTLRFEYKPLRMIWVDMPQKSGKLQRKAIYYMVYSVTNVPVQDQKDPPQYGWMVPRQVEEDTARKPERWVAEYKDAPIRFIPEFVLESPEYNKAYPDRVIPLAMAPIRAREDRLLPGWVNPKTTVPRRTLLDSVQMTRTIPVGETFWGVAVWEEVDPRIDRFHIYIQGLTNAYKWQDSPEAYAPGKKRDEYRTVVLKTLKLNFWRPGDKFEPEESEIRTGHPGEPDYEWLYLPSLSGK
ncbi:MAG: hypothetical protein PVH19_12555 [Planctomycetia bacterium]|jgi:hypothetical protein